MLTAKEMASVIQKGTFWEDDAPAACSPVETILWGMADELSVMLEMAYTLEEMEIIHPTAVSFLRRAFDHFEGASLLPSQSLALVILRLDRREFGMLDE